ncbi:MAG: hypothetical protein V4643_12855 [Bacteroidota bacterium]
METKQNIGKWTAIVKNEGKTAQITIDGTFPTNGEKPNYHLSKNEPQGINPTELLLTLVFGNSVTSEGTVYFSVHFNEAITTVEKYETVLVVDDNGRTMANINVAQY